MIGREAKLGDFVLFDLPEIVRVGADPFLGEVAE